MFHKSLIAYLVALREEGFNRIHVSSVIPASLPCGHKWTQFPVIDEALIDEAGIEYDRRSGWFTLDPKNFKKVA